MVNMNIDTVETSSFTSEGTRDSELTAPQVRRSSQSRSKVSGKRLTSEPQSAFSAPSASSASFDNDSSNILAGAGALWSQPWASNAGVAVPKNQQKNLISRERDNISRKMPSWRERLLPRNMQGQGHDPEAGSGIHDHDRGFINIQLELPEDSQRPEAAEAGPGGHER